MRSVDAPFNLMPVSLLAWRDMAERAAFAAWGSCRSSIFRTPKAPARPAAIATDGSADSGGVRTIISKGFIGEAPAQSLALRYQREGSTSSMGIDLSRIHRARG